MNVMLGAGWSLCHLTDRVVLLRKPDPVYRRFTGRDGYVKVRGEPGLDRNGLVEKAMALAKRNDELLAEKVSKQLVPRRLGGYQMQQQQLANRFGIPGQEPEERTYKP